MKKQTLTLLILILTLALAGCAGHAEEETLEPIDAAAWPTPAPAQPTPQPTPFPKIGLEDVQVIYNNEEAPAAESTTAKVEAIPTEPTEASAAVVAVEAQPSAEAPAAAAPVAAAPESVALDDLPAVTTGQVSISAVNVRQGPGPDAAQEGILTSGQQVDVLGVNARRDWVLVQTPDLSGWVSLAYVDLVDSVDDVPVIAPEVATTSNPVNTLPQQQAPALSNIATGTEPAARKTARRKPSPIWGRSRPPTWPSTKPRCAPAPVPTSPPSTS